jgi:16S rRNA C967 or C1407 C5-methylase (RsmB/RsmF family)
MNSQRKFDFLRVNDLKLYELGFHNLEGVKKEFEKLNITLYPDENLPYLYYTLDKVKIVKTSWYQEGLITFQDKGSVLIVDALNPHPKDIVYDMCAGPGMKTSLMAQKMYNNGTIIAIEFLKSRSEETKRLLENFNVQNTHLLNSDSISPPIAEHFKFDKVLLDAPCTGSGTFQFHPELKYRQNSQFLHQNVILQEKLILSAKKYLKPGGILLYSVCSLYPEEGELHFQKTKTQNLIPMDLPKYLADCYIINGESIAGAKRLFPSKHNTSGFFIAKFKKKD